MYNIQEIRSSVKNTVKKHILKYKNIPSSKEWDKLNYTPSRHTIKKYTNLTYKQLLIDLGFYTESPHKVKLQTKSEIINSCKKFYSDYGYTPSIDTFKYTKFLPSISNIYKNFNSLDDLLNECNIPLKVKGISKKYALNLLDSFIKEYNRVPNKSDLYGPARNKNYPEYRIYAKLFGGIKNAVLELDYSNNKCNKLLNIQSLDEVENDIISIIKDHQLKYNYIPGSKEWDNNFYKPSRKTIEKLFKLPFNKVLASLGFNNKNKSPTHISDNDLIDLLTSFYLQSGKTPTFEDLKNLDGFPHPMIYIRRFGSYENAITVAKLKSNIFLDKNFLISEVKRYINTEGHIPSTNTFRYNKNYPGIKAYTRVFGSFNKCLIQMGITPVCCETKNAYSKKCISIDGDLCNSVEESMVDNALFYSNWAHEREVLYPYHEKYNQNAMKRCDFRVISKNGNLVYIEYAGLINNEEYRKNIKTKIQLCKDNCLNIIVIYPYQLGQLDTILIKKLHEL